MTVKSEEELRQALAQCADEAPAAASERLRLIDYHPRSSRVRPSLVLASSAGAAALAAIALSIIGLGAGAQRAFAGWTPVTTMPAPGQVAAAQATCVKRLGASGRVIPPRASSAWHPVLSDARGPFTTVLYQADTGRAEASCLSGPSRYDWSLNATVDPRQVIPAAGQIAVVSYGSRATPRSAGGRHFRQIVGRVGAGVTRVVLVLRDSTRVTATSAQGWFLAWWPGTQQTVSAEVVTATGTSTQQLGPA